MPIHNKPFVDNEYAAVYLLLRQIAPAKLILQEEEVEAVQLFPLSEILARLDDPAFPNCLYRDELEMVASACTQRNQ